MCLPHRWGTIPAVRVAQLEKTVSLPPELVSSWASLQQHFGLNSDAGNMMANIVLNFHVSGEYVLKINSGLSPVVTSSEEEFSRICHEMEVLAVPVYHSIVKAIISFAGGDKVACLEHVRGIKNQLRPLLSSYYDRVHDARIARSVWLSHVQGFFAWGAGYQDATTGEWEKFDGLSGNQVLLFQAVDAFLGLEAYLTKKVLGMNVPELQREFCLAVGRHSFRHMLGEEGVEGQIKGEFTEIVKRLRVRTFIPSRSTDERNGYTNGRTGVPHGSSHPGQDLFDSVRPREAPHDGRQVTAQGGYGSEHAVLGPIHAGQTAADGLTASKFHENLLLSLFRFLLLVYDIESECSCEAI